MAAAATASGSLQGPAEKSPSPSALNPLGTMKTPPPKGGTIDSIFQVFNKKSKSIEILIPGPVVSPNTTSPVVPPTTIQPSTTPQPALTISPTPQPTHSKPFPSQPSFSLQTQNPPLPTSKICPSPTSDPYPALPAKGGFVRGSTQAKPQRKPASVPPASSAQQVRSWGSLFQRESQVPSFGSLRFIAPTIEGTHSVVSLLPEAYAKNVQRWDHGIKQSLVISLVTVFVDSSEAEEFQKLYPNP